MLHRLARALRAPRQSRSRFKHSLVNTISTGGSEYNAGNTAYYPLVGWRQTGCLVAARKTGPASAFESPSAIARTIAHEIGHYLFQNGDHETTRGWNLMRPGGGNDPASGSTNNSDLDRRQRETIGLQPDEVNTDEQ